MSTKVRDKEIFNGIKIKTPKGLTIRGLGIECLAVSYFHMRNLTLSSAQYGFTSEFGMGSGGSHTLLPPGKNCVVKYLDGTRRKFQSIKLYWATNHFKVI